MYTGIPKHIKTYQTVSDTYDVMDLKFRIVVPDHMKHNTSAAGIKKYIVDTAAHMIAMEIVACGLGEVETDRDLMRCEDIIYSTIKVLKRRE